jgi:hypothetical protein
VCACLSLKHCLISKPVSDWRRHVYGRENGLQWLWMIRLSVRANVSQLLQQKAKGKWVMGLNPREKLTLHYMVPIRPWKGVLSRMHFLTSLEAHEKICTCLMNLHSWTMWVAIYGWLEAAEVQARMGFPWVGQAFKFQCACVIKWDSARSWIFLATYMLEWFVHLGTRLLQL